MADLGVEILAVAALPLSEAQAFAKRYGIAHFSDDYRQVLQQPDLQIVDLCVPNHLHKPFAIEAAKAGKHVICEKPLTGYFGDGEENVAATPRARMLQEALRNADEMIEVANRCGVKLMYAENWLYSPTVRKAKALVEASGGTILEIRAQECHSGSHANYAKEWRYSGGGALTRLGPHPIGTGLYFKAREGLRRYGKPISVESLYAEVGDLSKTPSLQEERRWLVTDWVDVENWATVLINFSDGSRGVFWASDISLGGMEDTFELLLSNAHIKGDLTHSTLLRAYAPDSTIFAQEYIQEKLETKAGWSYPSIDEEWMLGYPQELRDFVEAVIYDREPLVTVELGREVVKVIYAAYLSAEEGRKIRFSELSEK
jgi:predicted dehydrogenase